MNSKVQDMLEYIKDKIPKDEYDDILHVYHSMEDKHHRYINHILDDYKDGVEIVGDAIISKVNHNMYTDKSIYRIIRRKKNKKEFIRQTLKKSIDYQYHDRDGIITVDEISNMIALYLISTGIRYEPQGTKKRFTSNILCVDSVPKHLNFTMNGIPSYVVSIMIKNESELPLLNVSDMDFIDILIPQKELSDKIYDMIYTHMKIFHKTAFKNSFMKEIKIIKSLAYTWSNQYEKEATFEVNINEAYEKGARFVIRQ